MTDAEKLRLINEHLTIANALQIELKQVGWLVTLEKTYVGGWPLVNWPLKASATRTEQL